MKFYTADWRADPKLRICSHAARGVWADMITIMHEAEPYGHLMIADTVLTAKHLSGMLGGSEAEMTAILSELRQNGVFSETDEGVIYSRRMVRDAEKSKEGYENGVKGGNPKLTDRDNPPDKKRATKGYPSDTGNDAKGLRGGDKLTTIVTASTTTSSKDTKQQHLASARETAKPANGHAPPPGPLPKPDLQTKPPMLLPFDKLCQVLKLDPVKERKNSAWLTFGATFQDWIDRGCDAEKDIWPVLERVGMKYRAKHRALPQTPGYFVLPVFEARDQRLEAQQVLVTEPHFDRHKWGNVLRVWRDTGGWIEDKWGPDPTKPNCFAPQDMRVVDDATPRLQIHDPANPREMIRGNLDGTPYEAPDKPKPVPKAPEPTLERKPVSRRPVPERFREPVSTSLWQMRLQQWRDSRFWPETGQWGPAPTEPDCHVPPHMMTAPDHDAEAPEGQHDPDFDEVEEEEAIEESGQEITP